MDDIWSGLAYSLADLIAKHAGEIILEDEPTDATDEIVSD